MTPQDYIRELAERLAADDCEPQWDTSAAPFLIGHRADFRLRWLATRMHLFTIAAVVPEITLPRLEEFTAFALETAIRRKPGLARGLQTGVAVFPTLISDRVEPAALQRAMVWQKVRFGAFGRPTVVDTAARTVGTYRSTPIIGTLYGPYLRRKSELYFPQPE